MNVYTRGMLDSLHVAHEVDAAIALAIGSALNQWGARHGLQSMAWTVSFYDYGTTISGTPLAVASWHGAAEAREWAEVLHLVPADPDVPDVWVQEFTKWHIEVRAVPL